MTEREKIIEAMARAICVTQRMNEDDALGGWIHWRGEAIQALTAIAEQRYAVVPRNVTEEMQRVGFRNNRHVNSEPCGKPTCIAAVTMPADKAYRAMVDAADIARPVKTEDVS